MAEQMQFAAALLACMGMIAVGRTVPGMAGSLMMAIGAVLLLATILLAMRSSPLPPEAGEAVAGFAFWAACGPFLATLWLASFINSQPLGDVGVLCLGAALIAGSTTRRRRSALGLLHAA